MNREQQQINEHWSNSSANYDRIIHDELSSFRLNGWQNQIRRQVGYQENLRVLDCGCGPAFFTIILSKTGYRVTGIDASDGMLEKAYKNVKEYGVDAQILKMDCHALDFPDNSFDLVVSRNVTHTLRDHVKVYSEWLRVLKPGGTLLIFDANWHLSMSEKAVYEESMERRRKCIEVFGSDFNGNTTFDEERFRQEDAGERHALGNLIRPDWDCGILQAVGFSDIYYERDIIEHLWDDKEKLIYGNTPMFMIRARKN